MKTIKFIVALLLLGMARLVCIGNAWADRGYVHFGVVVGPYGVISTMLVVTSILRIKWNGHGIFDDSPGF
jgi:hypothetical protein